LLNELLELSRIGRIMNPPQEVLFGDIVREAAGLVHGQIEARGVEVRIARNLPPVYGDRARLVEVVQNLLDNAVKFMGEQSKPCVEIGMRGADEKGNPIFYVRDNGIGIEPQYHERVFGLFNKLDSHTEGTGVGLALVKRIIEVHGGKIWIESKGDGQGATFCFIIASRLK
jgi:signal transduction histidine kinase